MTPRFAQLPSALRSHAITTRLAGVPALLAHPDAHRLAHDGTHAADSLSESAARPIVLWMHGRTVSKELDPGRYLRWTRAGLAACALDLPGHGERFVPGRQGADAALEVVEEMAGEIDAVLTALAEGRWRGAFDLSRVAVGGMSAGGMATLIRLGRPHPFRCACIEATASDFSKMTASADFHTRAGRDPTGEMARRLNPAAHVREWRAIPLLALHSEADEWVPVAAVRSFIDALRAAYSQRGEDPSMIELRTWERTGAPHEHAGFGRFASEAKDTQLTFLKKWLA